MSKRVALTEGLFTGIDDPSTARLLAGRCEQCSRLRFPAQSLCPYCAADGCQVIELGREGVLDLCTTVVNRPPGYDGPMPFGFGVVELPEGIRIISRVLEPEQSRPGMRVRLSLETLCQDEEGRDVVTYAFTLVSRPPNP
jgi:uncharacterized OB-fold protein